MTTLIYAGIGSRATPGAVLADMTKMAGWLSRTGWHLASGGADGADSAFAGDAPAGRRTLYLPWHGYNGHGGPDCRTLSRCRALRLHGHRRPPASRLAPLLACGAEAARKERGIVLLWCQSRPARRCGHRMDPGRCRHRAAPGWPFASRPNIGIPVMNLAAMTSRAACERLLAIRRAS